MGEEGGVVWHGYCWGCGPKGVSLPFAGNILTIKFAAKVAWNVKLTLH